MLISFRTFLLIAALLAALVTAPQSFAFDWNLWGKKIVGSGVIKAETRALSGFSGISLGIPAKLTVVQNGTESVTITADDNVLPLISTEVSGTTLKIRWTEKNINLSSKNLRITVNLKAVQSLAVEGSGDIMADGLTFTELLTSIGGSGDIQLRNLAGEKVKASVAGSGDVFLTGNVGVFDVSIAGSGDIKAERLAAKTVSVSIAGSGNAVVLANESLRVSVAGSGDVRHYGSAKVSTSIAGSGSVKHLGAGPS